jgi:hypothetical protein
MIYKKEFIALTPHSRALGWVVIAAQGSSTSRSFNSLRVIVVSFEQFFMVSTMMREII